MNLAVVVLKNVWVGIYEFLEKKKLTSLAELERMCLCRLQLEMLNSKAVRKRMLPRLNFAAKIELCRTARAVENIETG